MGARFLCVSILIIYLASFALSNFCPGHKIRCKKGQTCCSTGSSYGCCPYINATCCLDRRHCCPFGMDCDTTQGQCKQRQQHPLLNVQDNEIPVDPPKGKGTVHARILNLIDKLIQHKEKTTCPDQKQKCPSEYTCCEQTIPGMYGCCPFQEATCCKDKIHCCPKNSQCNIKSGRCE